MLLIAMLVVVEVASKLYCGRICLTFTLFYSINLPINPFDITFIYARNDRDSCQMYVYQIDLAVSYCSILECKASMRGGVSDISTKTSTLVALY